MSETLNTENIGKAIAFWRKHLGYSQKDFAKKIGIAPQNMSKIEKNKWNISLKKLNEIATALGVNTVSLLKGIPPQEEFEIIIDIYKNLNLTQKELEHLMAVRIPNKKLDSKDYIFILQKYRDIISLEKNSK